MTTPTGQIKMSDVRLEIYGSATGQIDMNDPNVYTLAGKSSGQISMSDLQGKSWITYSPAGPNVSDTKSYPTNAQVTITSSKAVVWTYTQTQSATGSSVSIPSGTSTTSITFTQTPSSGSADRQSAWNLTATFGSSTKNFTVSLHAIAQFP